MTPQTLREYGLEFINEIAKDREVAQQEIGVSISGAKSILVSQGTQHFSYKDIEEFVKQVRKETAQIVDNELTRITIKSLGRIREIIQGDSKFLEKVVSEEGMEQLSELKSEIELLKKQLEEKTARIVELEADRDHQYIRYEEQREELNNSQIEVKKVQLQLQNLQDQNATNLKRFDEIANELAAKEALIGALKQNEKLHEKDIEEALASIAETYKIQENYYQRMLEEQVQQRIKEIRAETDLQIEEMQLKLSNSTQRHEAELRHHKNTNIRLQEELTLSEEERQTLRRKLTEITNERAERNLLLGYIERLLSSHPVYAAVLILLNLGGSLDLPTMARSVGAHPVKLLGMLEDFGLVTKGLISISSDDPPTVRAIMTK